MTNAIYDERKKVYRVNNADGTFNTYTPEQYRALAGDKVVEEEETNEEETQTDVQDGVQDDVQDTPIENEQADVVLQTPNEQNTGDTPITNEPNPQS